MQRSNTFNVWTCAVRRASPSRPVAGRAKPRVMTAWRGSDKAAFGQSCSSNTRIDTRVTRMPRRQRFAVVLPRFLVKVEDARITTVAAAVCHIGLDGRSRRRVIAQESSVGRGRVVGHRSHQVLRHHDGAVVGRLQAGIMRKGTLRRAPMLRRSRAQPTERR